MAAESSHSVGGAQCLRILIVDDEPLARARLRHMLQGLEGHEGLPALHVQEASDAEAAERMVDSFQVILLDIQMPGLSGMDWARSLMNRPVAPAVIFTSAHPENALAAFEVAATDFLPKPFSRERLLLALRRAPVWMDGADRAALSASDPKSAHALIFSDSGRLQRVDIPSILYLRAEWKYVTLRTAEKSYVLEESLIELEGRLGGGFLRVHRNALVSLQAIAALDWLGSSEHPGWAVRIKSVDEWIDVSRRQLATVRRALQQNG
jgi:two-component system, LytTR family, response regulator AlgR